MAYDFGSQTLGIKNPFKTEGKIYTVAALVVFAIGIYPLLQVPELLKTDKVAAYGYAILGALLIISSVTAMKGSLFALFRFFVGRSVPTSLAYNCSSSERDAAQQEKNHLLYSDESLHSMLMGRKNNTFIEPKGWVGRLIHSLIPKLTFLPYKLRNLTQELTGMALNMVMAVVIYLVLWFVVGSGLAGEKAQVVLMPVVSVLLLIYLVSTWVSAARSLSDEGKTRLVSTGNASFGGLIVFAILLPIGLGYLLETQVRASVEELRSLVDGFSLFGAGPNLLILLAVIAVAVGVILPVLIPRMSAVKPETEVSEWRDNFQESVHPNEIFINIENIVLANRRYKEIPNRIYQEWSPSLTEQSQGKGAFRGQLMIETQPEYQGEMGNKSRKLLLTMVGGLSYVVSACLLLALGFAIIDVVSTALSGGFDSAQAVKANMGEINSLLVTGFAFLTVRAGSKILSAASHMFWGEMHFSSLLMFMKTEGTYSESKISTGMAYNDSTRSENEVVRSSITPWIISSRIHTSVFATTGVNNLEQPRFVLSMSKNDSELDTIKGEIVDFLKGREYIASITNESDLRNISNVDAMNQQSKSALENNGEKPQDKLTAEDIGKINHHQADDQEPEKSDV